MWSDSPLESSLSCAVVSYRLMDHPGGDAEIIYRA